MRFLVLIATVMSWLYLSFEMGKAHGIEQGKKKALNTNPVSDELEMTCAGLWVGEQNKKAIAKEKK